MNNHKWNKSRKLLDAELLVVEHVIGWGLVVWFLSSWLGV